MHEMLGCWDRLLVTPQSLPYTQAGSQPCSVECTDYLSPFYSKGIDHISSQESGSRSSNINAF